MIIPMQPGTENSERVRLLLVLCPKFGDNTKQAITKHLVNGWPIETVCNCFDLLQPNFKRSLDRLNEVNHTVEQIKEFDLYHLTDLSAANDFSVTPPPEAA